MDELIERKRQLAKAQQETRIWQEWSRIWQKWLVRQDHELDAAVSRLEQVEASEMRLREALRSIARNTCCKSCQEAARVAQAALAVSPKPTPSEEKL